jgi:hypothetical protein
MWLHLLESGGRDDPSPAPGLLEWNLLYNRLFIVTAHLTSPPLTPKPRPLDTPKSQTWNTTYSTFHLGVYILEEF